MEEILDQLIDSLSHYLQGFIQVVQDFSINSMFGRNPASHLEVDDLLSQELIGFSSQVEFFDHTSRFMTRLDLSDLNWKMKPWNHKESKDVGWHI